MLKELQEEKNLKKEDDKAEAAGYYGDMNAMKDSKLS